MSQTSGTLQMMDGHKGGRSTAPASSAFLIRRHEEEHPKHEQEELWIFSYADLITNLLLFFLMMFAISSIDDDKLKKIGEAAKGSVTQAVKARNDPVPELSQSQLASIEAQSGSDRNSAIMEKLQVLLSKVDQEALKADAQKKQAFDKLQKEMEKIAKVTPDFTKGVDSMDVRFPSDRLFLTGREIPTQEAISFLNKLASELKRQPNKFSIVVEGHTDSTEAAETMSIANMKTNRTGEAKNTGPKDAKRSTAPIMTKWELSSRRASAVIGILRENGVVAESITIAGYADTKPLLPERDATGHLLPQNQSVNRRVNIKIIRTTTKTGAVE